MIHDPAGPGADPIESFLDELLAGLRGTSADVRRSLLECESHLREQAEAEVAAGRDPRTAAANAVAAFGSARHIAAQLNRAHRPLTLRALLPGVVDQAWQLTVVGLTAIGASGVLAWLLTIPFGTGPVFADAPGTRYDAASCAHYRAGHPGATTCAQAALAEGRDDALLQRIALGVLGLILLAGLLWWRRRRAASGRRTTGSLSTAAALVGLVTFGAAGVGLTGFGIDRAVINTGAGQWLAAGTVALVVAVGYVGALWRRLTPLPAA